MYHVPYKCLWTGKKCCYLLCSKFFRPTTPQNPNYGMGSVFGYSLTQAALIPLNIPPLSLSSQPTLLTKAKLESIRIAYARTVLQERQIAACHRLLLDIDNALITQYTHDLCWLAYTWMFSVVFPQQVGVGKEDEKQLWEQNFSYNKTKASSIVSAAKFQILKVTWMIIRALYYRFSFYSQIVSSGV